MFETINELEDWIRDEFNHFGISDWGFKWNNRTTKVLGRCFCVNKTIELSRKFVLLNIEQNPKEIRNVILHEIAHALEYKYERTSGHGERWKFYCNVTGARPDQFIDSRKINLVARSK